MGKINNNFNKNKKIISLTQILILLIGILAFSYILEEIGKKSGIEISRGIGFVNAQNLGEGCADQSCSDPYICNLNTNKCEERASVGFTDKNGEKREVEIPKSEADKGQKGASDYLSSISQGAGLIITAEQIWRIGAKVFGGGGASTTGGVGTATGMGPPTEAQWLAQQGVKEGAKVWGTEGGSVMGPILISFATALATATAIYFIFKLAGAGDENLNMIANSGIFGVIAGTATGPLILALTTLTFTTGGLILIAFAATAVVMLVWTFFGYQDYVSEIINYQISAWQPQSGGAKCDECNKLEYGCTEYQCKTFGQGCGIVNNGTKQERCVWLNPDDREYPVIIEDAEISQFPENYNYKKSTDVSPPDTGVEITSTSQNCIPPFSSLILGVKTDEPAQCRVSANRTKNFDTMVKDMDEGALAIEKHTKTLPNSATANNWALNNLVDNSGLPDENQDGVADIEFEITKGNEYAYYIKCKDTNGNENPANFVIKFCIQDKDLTAPMIKGFFVADGSFVQFNTPDVTTEVYTNEPAECKWDFSDKKYGDMSYGMTNCDTTINQASVSGNSCTGNFTGLANGKENKYYVRCQDRSEDKNTNSVSEVYTLKVSSQTILIDSISVNGKGNNSIIKDSRNFIPVDLEIKTSFGAEDGKAKCEYEYLGNKIPMSFDYSGINTQTLWLPEGKHELPISCNDIAGDTATGSISFTIVTDRDAPIVARAYYDVNNLKVITNEPAECVYTTQSNLGCAYEFKDGTAMSEIGELTHYTSWQAGKKYFIKCKDAFGNQPVLPNQCSIIVKAFESY